MQRRDLNLFLIREWIKKNNLVALLLRQNFARKHFDIFGGKYLPIIILKQIKFSMQRRDFNRFLIREWIKEFNLEASFWGLNFARRY